MEGKRNAILDAATRVLAGRGLTDAPTSEISKQAGVAEGTLFTYFKIKDDLINALLPPDQVRTRRCGDVRFSAQEKCSRRLRHVGDGYVNGRVTNPDRRRVPANRRSRGAFERVD